MAMKYSRMTLVLLIFLSLVIVGGWVGTSFAEMNPYVAGAVVRGGGESATVSHVSTSSATADTASITITAPSGIQDGDRMMMCVGNDSVSGTWTTPTGWTVFQTGTAGNNIAISCYYRDASSETGDYTATNNSTSSKSGVISVFRKTSGTWATPTSNSSDGASGTSMTSDNLMSVAGGIMWSVWFNDGAFTVSTAPSGVTAPSGNTGYASSSGHAAYYEATASAANYSRSITWSGTEQMGAIQATVSIQ